VQREVVTLRDIEGFEADKVCQLLELRDANQRSDGLGSYCRAFTALGLGSPVGAVSCVEIDLPQGPPGPSSRRLVTGPAMLLLIVVRLVAPRISCCLHACVLAQRPGAHPYTRAASPMG
jgi:hypothetical protein